MREGMKKVKRSVDLSPEIDGLLDDYRDLFSGPSAKSRGSAIEGVVGTVLRTSPDQASVLYRTCSTALGAAQDRLDATSEDDPYARDAALAEVRQWQELATLFRRLSRGKSAPAPMRRIEMARGALIIPDRPDWVLLNPERADTATGAEIVEIRNGQRYGAPHFVHLDNETFQRGEIERLMLEKWPGYRAVLEDTIVPAYDGEGRQINLDEWAQAPEPLFYRVTANLGMPFRNRGGVQLILKEKEAPEGT